MKKNSDRNDVLHSPLTITRNRTENREKRSGQCSKKETMDMWCAACRRHAHTNPPSSSTIDSIARRCLPLALSLSLCVLLPSLQCPSDSMNVQIIAAAAAVAAVLRVCVHSPLLACSPFNFPSLFSLHFTSLSLSLSLDVNLFCLFSC